MSQSSSNSLFRHLGAFFGHIVQGIKHDPAGRPLADPASDVAVFVRKRVETQTREMPENAARVTLTRTTTDEVRIEPLPESAP